jgi:ubiquinone/menaquinone biosynthesis C-methylase UbiE
MRPFRNYHGKQKVYKPHPSLLYVSHLHKSKPNPSSILLPSHKNHFHTFSSKIYLPKMSSTSTHDSTLSPAMQSAQSRWHLDSIAEKYLNAENATRPFAKILVSKSNLSQLQDEKDKIHILDLACGTGAAVQEIYDAVPKPAWSKMSVYGGDVSAGMVEYLASRGEKNGWVGLETGVIDGNEIDFPNETFTHALCTFGVFIMPKSMGELYRVTKKGGWVGVTTWVRFQWYGFILPAAIYTMYTPSFHSSAILIPTARQDPPRQPQHITHVLCPI